MLLPLGGDGEQQWPNGLRIVLYLLGLLWCFMGVGIVSDVFMSAIEAVTAKKKRVPLKGAMDHNKNPRMITVKVWNDTVANLTLMALGSSAPEILLSIIELLGASFYSGALGPSTIVGSAAFNLFCISAVCVSAIPSGESRKIKDTSVFAVTATFSVFAYLWLVVILMLSSPNVVEIWEGVLTFLYFPVLVILAYLADKGYFSSSKEREEVETTRVIAAEMTKEELAEKILKIQQQYGSNLSEKEAINILERDTAQPKSRAEYRVAAGRAMTGGKRVGMNGPDPKYLVQKVEGTSDDAAELAKKNQIQIEFASAKYAVLESGEKVTVTVERKGNISVPCEVEYKTKDGTANAGTDYVHVEGKLEFPAGKTQAEINVKIIDDTAYELDEDFYVLLSNPCLAASAGAEKTEVMLGTVKETKVTIIDDDEPGMIFFQKETETINEDCNDKTVSVVVERKNGSKGVIKVKCWTEGDSATPGSDYEEIEEQWLEFEDGQMSATIDIVIKARGRYDGTEMFRLYMGEISSYDKKEDGTLVPHSDKSGDKKGATFDKMTDGGEDQCIMTIFIVADESQKKKIDALTGLLQMNWDKTRVGHANYKDQFVQALYVNGMTPEDEDYEKPSTADYFTHFLALPWKLTFALIPPPDYGGGWVCFCIALCFIGGVTAIIGDMAALLGCTMGVPDSITAITFVALGTSLPDTFASKTAATQDPYADASIGNVTGSNSVNVFLGLGMPWLMGACYWTSMGATDEWKAMYANSKANVVAEYPAGGFVVEAGDLGFSVIVFSICACATIGLMVLRRRTCEGELGGPDGLKKASSAVLVCFWFIYVGLSAWKSMSSLQDK